jgi:23S rRNA pseudouridine2605 synthase
MHPQTRRTDERNRHKPRRSTEPVFTEPQRLHKVLAQCGYGSLRGLEEMIVAGRITINRMPAEIGQKVGPDDQVRINGELVKLRFAPPRVRVLLYHKPAGEIVSRHDPENRPTVFDKLPRLGHAKWIAVGRLDFNTEGLLLFTTSGELANRLMHPRYEVVREYAIRTVGTLSPEQEAALLQGVQLEDGPAKVMSLADGGGEGTNHWYKITLPEGRNREVRRLFEALGMMVSRLTRTRYGLVAMPPQLKRGQTAELERGDLNALLKSVGLAPLDGGDERPRVNGDDIGNTGTVEDDADEMHEVDGNRGTYGAQEQAPISDEDLDRIDGNRAPVSRTQQPGNGRQPRHGTPRGFPHGPLRGQAQGQHRGGQGKSRNARGGHSAQGNRAPQGGGQGQGATTGGMPHGNGSGAPHPRGRRGRRGGRGGRNGGPGAPRP